MQILWHSTREVMSTCQHSLKGQGDLADFNRPAQILPHPTQITALVSCSSTHVVKQKPFYEVSEIWSLLPWVYGKPLGSIGLFTHSNILILGSLFILTAKKKSISLPAKVADNSQSHDDYCSVCSRSGELLLCDTCPHVYHLECANLTNIPDGTWSCPKCVHLMKPKVVAPVKM